MMDAYNLAQTLLSDAQDPVPETKSVMSEGVEEGTIDDLPEEVKCGLESLRVITHDAWKLVDEEEVRRGAVLGGKERERMDWNEVHRYLQSIRRVA